MVTSRAAYKATRYAMVLKLFDFGTQLTTVIYTYMSLNLLYFERKCSHICVNYAE